jgi:hypothetical protein
MTKNINYRIFPINVDDSTKLEEDDFDILFNSFMWCPISHQPINTIKSCDRMKKYNDDLFLILNVVLDKNKSSEILK